MQQEPGINPDEQEPDSPLVDAALAAGAERIDQPAGDLPEPIPAKDSVPDDEGPAKVKSIKDALGGRKINYYPDLPRYEFASLVGHSFIIKGATTIDDWDGQFGTTKFAIMRIELANGQGGTTLNGGKAIYKQITRLVTGKLFPVRVTLKYESGEQGGQPYYLFDE